MEKKIMLTFAITTTTKLAAISLHEGEKLLGEIRMEVLKTHSTTILDQIDRLFEWTGKNLEEVENVLVAIGPGSFTGVRIAISVVKGLFFGKKVNLYSINELDANAYQVYLGIINSIEKNSEEKIRIYSLIDSGKEKVYYAEYIVIDGDFKRKIEYRVGKLDDVLKECRASCMEMGKVYFSGDAVFNYKNKIKDTLKDKAILVEDERLKISSSTFFRMFLMGKLEKSDIYRLKPDYLEKTQAERDKK